jgi:hypothetical protein
MPAPSHSITDHFEDRAPAVKATYTAILKAARKFGPVVEEANCVTLGIGGLSR